MQAINKGTQLADRYTLDRHLGGGGEAQIWLAKDRLTGAQVALKIVAAATPAAARLREEWQTQIRLMHAHIVRVFEFHSDDEVAFYSQQYIDGPDISVLTGRSLEDVLAPVALVADALRYAHSKGIVHRDIKATNILLDRNGAPYLSDFGVAAKVGATGGGGSLIAQSPQSLAGEPVQAADDIFALGGLIYELVASRSAYSSASTADDIRHLEPPPLQTSDRADVEVAVRQLVARMLDKDATRRPVAEQVIAELEKAGYRGGTAKIEVQAQTALRDEVVETVESIHPIRKAAAASTVADTEAQATGISPRILGIALAVSLLVLIGVVFLLPKTVEVDPRRPSGVVDGQDPAGLDIADDPGGEGSLLGEERASRNYVPEARGLDDENILFNENDADYSGLDDEGRTRFNAEMILGELLSNFETLERRGVQRWAALEFQSARERYAAGDKAYLERDYGKAERLYLEAIAIVEPLFDRIEPEFQAALTAAEAAFEAGDRTEALRLYELAVAITPNSPAAVAGFERAKNLESVLRLVEQGLDYEEELELEAAETSFRQAVTIDPEWLPAQEGLARVQATRTQMQFDLRMSEGLEALAAGDYPSARAAFRMAAQLMPGSREPADGLMQVEQGMQLDDITVLEQEAVSLERDEHWDAVVTTYDEILKIDGALAFAIEGRARAREMSALHKRLDDYIADPDKLSLPSVMQKATLLVVDITRMPEIGPRLAGQRDELSRLLKRAATPVPVALVSDNLTQVSVYKIGSLGRFSNTRLELRPGTYVAVGVRPGFRDVRLEFRVAPEIEMQPVVVRCEEQI